MIPRRTITELLAWIGRGLVAEWPWPEPTQLATAMVVAAAAPAVAAVVDALVIGLVG